MADAYVKKISEPQTDEGKELYAKMKEMHQGNVPAWMEVMANNEDIMLTFFAMFKKIMDDSPLSSHFKWKIAYTVSKLNECKYCVSVATQMLLNFGMSESELENMNNNLDEREKLAFEYAIEINNNAYKIDPELIEKVKREFNDSEMVELVSVVGLFNFINRFNDALGVLPE